MRCRVIRTFAAIIFKKFRLASWALFKQRGGSRPEADKELFNPLFSLSLSNLFKCQKNISLEMNFGKKNCVIKWVDLRPKNRLQLILILHKKVKRKVFV